MWFSLHSAWLNSDGVLVQFLVVSLEPDGPLARVLAGQQPWQPGGPDVGVFAVLCQGSALGGRIACYGLAPDGNRGE